MKLVSFVVIVPLLLLAGCATAETNQNSPAAPPRRCEIRQSAWCIQEGAYEIIDRLADDSVHDRFWIMKGFFKPESKLVILEPYGCNNGFSDTFIFLDFERGVKWGNRTWDRLRVRLKKDETCDLEALMPPYNGDPMEWAFSTGLGLVKRCKDEMCIGESLADLKPMFENKFQKRGKR